MALQRCDELRVQYMQDMSIYSKDMFIFADETGADRRNSMRRFGYSLRGKRDQRLLVRGKRLSAISAIATNGVLDCHIVEGNVNADVFEEVVER